MVTIKSMVVVVVYILFISLYFVVGKTRIKMRHCFGETPNSPFDKGRVRTLFWTKNSRTFQGLSRTFKDFQGLHALENQRMFSFS